MNISLADHTLTFVFIPVFATRAKKRKTSPTARDRPAQICAFRKSPPSVEINAPAMGGPESTANEMTKKPIPILVPLSRTSEVSEANRAGVRL